MATSSIHTNLIAGSQPRVAPLFGVEVVRFRHRLASTGLFTRDALARLIEACPTEHLGIRAIVGEAPDVARLEGILGNATGTEAIAAIEKGKIWMNIRRIMEWAPQYRSVLDSVFDELAELVPQLKTFKRSMGVLISSPGAWVPYHADIQGQSLWQIEGEKSISIFPSSSEFISPESLERILLREADEDIPYEHWFSNYAKKIELRSGDMIAWPLYAPHRVDNHDCLNISVTMEYWTDEIWKSYAVRYGNGVLRRTLGLRRLSTEAHGFHVYPKATSAALWKWLGRQTKGDVITERQFRIDAASTTGRSQIF